MTDKPYISMYQVNIKFILAKIEVNLNMNIDLSLVDCLATCMSVHLNQSVSVYM